ncbi:hypothetical protein SOVF_009420, partial [Spinacia oleracea]
ENFQNFVDCSDDEDPESGKNNTNCKPMPTKEGDGEFKRQRKLTSDVWADFDFLHRVGNGILHYVVKFEKYWATFSTVMVMAVVLDPRYKFQIVEWGYEKIYGASYNLECAMMKDKLVSLFDEYKAESCLMKANDDARNAAMSNNQPRESDSLMMMPTKVVKSELESYLEEQLMPRTTDLNVLEFWRTHETRYSTLARMARDILLIPISMVASESAFSTGGRLLDAYRSSLLLSVVEAIICLRDWVFGQVKMEPQLEELCGAIMKLKAKEQVDAIVNVDDIPPSPIAASPGTQDSNQIDA